MVKGNIAGAARDWEQEKCDHEGPTGGRLWSETALCPDWGGVTRTCVCAYIHRCVYLLPKSAHYRYHIGGCLRFYSCAGWASPLSGMFPIAAVMGSLPSPYLSGFLLYGFSSICIYSSIDAHWIGSNFRLSVSSSEYSCTSLFVDISFYLFWEKCLGEELLGRNVFNSVRNCQKVS